MTFHFSIDGLWFFAALIAAIILYLLRESGR